VELIIKKNQKEVETTMFRLDRIHNDRLPDHMYNDAIGYMRTVVRFSIKDSFAEVPFWK